MARGGVPVESMGIESMHAHGKTLESQRGQKVKSNGERMKLMPGCQLESEGEMLRSGNPIPSELAWLKPNFRPLLPIKGILCSSK